LLCIATAPSRFGVLTEDSRPLPQDDPPRSHGFRLTVCLMFQMAREPPSRSAQDAELVRLAQRGDRAAFDRLARRYRGVLLATAYARTSDRGEAEDLVQDVLATTAAALPRHLAAALGGLRETRQNVRNVTLWDSEDAHPAVVCHDSREWFWAVACCPPRHHGSSNRPCHRMRSSSRVRGYLMASRSNAPSPCAGMEVSAVRLPPSRGLPFTRHLTSPVSMMQRVCSA